MRKRMTKLLQVCLLIAAVAIPAHVVYAYFTDYEKAKGGAVIHLSGQTEEHETVTDGNKTISIENTGSSLVFVRVKAFGDFIASEEPADGDWTKGTDGFWYYNKILVPAGAAIPAGDNEAWYAQQQTSDLVINLDAEAADQAGHGFDIIVVHEAEVVAWENDGTNNIPVIPEGWQITLAGSNG